MKKTLVAYDFSGSTEENEYYHRTVSTLLEGYADYDVVLWDNKLEVSTKERLKQINRWKEGRGGTTPIVVARYLAETKFDGNVIFITDGQIFERYVKELDEYLDQNPLSVTHMDFYLIQTCNDKLDATVIAPFLRRYKHIVFFFEEGTEVPRILAEGGKTIIEFVAQLRSINTVEEFESQYDSLFTETVAKVLGKNNDTSIKDEILRLRQRLIDSMKAPPAGFDMAKLKAAYDRRDTKELVSLCAELDNQYFDKYPSPEWPGKIFHLLRMCTGNLESVYSLAALSSKYNSDRVRRADIVQAFDISDVEVNDTGAEKFVCPVSYEEESDVVILIKKPAQTLISGLDENWINLITANPLNALNNQRLVDAIASCLDHPISLRTLHEAEKCGNPIKVSPLTRAEVIGGLCLGADEEHCKATDYIISVIVSGGKRIGNSNLWFAVIWSIIESGKVPYLNDVLPQIRSHMLFRLANHSATLSLSNVPFNCLTNVPLGVATWYSLNTIAADFSLNKAVNMIKPHFEYATALMKLNELQKMPMDDESSSFFRKAVAFLYTRGFAKSGNNDALDDITRLGFDCIEIDTANVHFNKFPWVPKYIPIDGEGPSQELRNEILARLPSIFSLLTADERRALAKLATCHFFSKMQFSTVDQEVSGVNWVYGLRDIEIPEVKICPATLRPYTHVGPDGKTWQECSEGIFGPLEEQIHIHAIYLNFIRKFKVYLTKEELLVYAFHQFIPNQKPTLPRLIEKFVDCVFAGYKEIFDAHTYKAREFRHKFDVSTPIPEREKREIAFKETGEIPHDKAKFKPTKFMSKVIKKRNMKKKH